MKLKIKKVLFFLDLIPVLLMIILSILLRDGLALSIVATLTLMLIWHYTEHTILKPRFDLEPQDKYVGYMEWPNFAFTAMVLVAFLEKLCDQLGFDLSFAIPLWMMSGDRITVIVSGYVLMLVGIVLRSWSYVTLKEEFAKAPGLNKKYIQQGPYRFGKHPANVGFFMISMGMALGFYSIGAFCMGLVLLIPALVFVSVFEQRRLRKTTWIYSGNPS